MSVFLFIRIENRHVFHHAHTHTHVDHKFECLIEVLVDGRKRFCVAKRVASLLATKFKINFYIPFDVDEAAALEPHKFSQDIPIN